MKYVVLTTGEMEVIPTTVSLNTIMVDGTGMCGGCRFLTSNGETKFACIDGPDVDGHDVDFDNLIERSHRFSKVEKTRLKDYIETCHALELNSKHNQN